MRSNLNLQRLIVFVVLFFTAGVPIAAFDILDIKTISDRDGLSQNTVRCMMQDSKGFMWLGTINGLNRYNGREFMVMQPETGSSLSLPDSRIRNIVEDRHGYIWIRTTSNTVCCYDPRLETFIDYDPANESKNFSNILVASNGDVWLWGNRQGCCRVRQTDGTLQAWRLDEKVLNSYSVSFVYEDSRQRIWIGTNKELFMVSDETVISKTQKEDFFSVHESGDRLFFVTNNRIIVFDNGQQSFLSDVSTDSERPIILNGTALVDNLILIATKTNLYAFDTKTLTMTSVEKQFRGKPLRNAYFLTDNKGNKWVYNMSGVLWRHRQGKGFEPIQLIPPEILSSIDLERYEIYHDSRNIIWITTYGNGLFAIDLNDGSTYHYTSEKELTSNYLLCVTEDKSGEIWVGTEFTGVNKISLSNYPVNIFYPAKKGEGGNRNNAVRMIYNDSDNRYWFGTRNGYMYVCDSSFRELYRHHIIGGLPFAITEDTLGNKWVGTRGKGVLIFPPDGSAAPQTYSLSDRERQNSSSNNIFGIVRDAKNRIWVASFGGGLHLAIRRDNELTFRQINMRNEHQDMMRGIIQDRTGLIWVGCNEGVHVFDPDELIRDESKYINFRYDMRDNNSLNNNEVKTIFEDRQGRIWLGTTGGGLNLLMREEPIERSWFKHYTAKNGLSNEVIQSIIGDDRGFIWVSTERGISKFDPKTERFENFIFSDNRQAALFNEMSCLKKKNGELMFGSYNGVYIFDPSKIVYDTYTPPVVITDLRINGNGVRPGEQDSPLTESIATTQSIILEHNRNSFNLEFAMLNFHSPEFNRYSYYLEGYEKNWNPVSRYNIAAYRNVPPGDYQFKVKGCNSSGVWSDTETTLRIVIRSPWWTSGWAILLYAAIMLAVIVFVSRMLIKINRLNMAVEVEKQLTEYKLRFFTNISHEFRTPLTIIRGSIENLSSMEDLPHAVGKQISTLAKSSTRLLRLIDQLLEFRRLQNNRMELKLEQTEAVEFFYDIYLTFKEMAGKKHIEFVFESNEQERDMLLDRSKMDKIVYNLLSNAFKNTPDDGKILMKLVFSTADDTLTLKVEDTGAGIPQDQRNMLFVRFKQINYASDGTGVGLHLTSELAAVHKGSVIYSDSDLGGACFSVTLPLSDKNYDREDIIHDLPAKTVEAVAAIPVQDAETIDPGQLMVASVAKPFKDYKLMVIEDNDDVREFIQSQLGEYFTVSTASNGTEGLEKVGNEQPDLVLCDVMMPGLDGFELTKRLKNNFETSHIPVVMLTAYSTEERRLEGIQAGADAYITKPFSMKLLMTRIVKLIEQREKLQQKYVREPGLVRPSIGFTDRDKNFLNKLHNVIEKNIDNTAFSIDGLAQALGMGRTVFYKKVKGITGHSPNEYLRIIRMKKAAELLTTTGLNVSEVSYRIGMNDPFYFSKCFKMQFKKSPSQYQKEKDNL